MPTIAKAQAGASVTDYVGSGYVRTFAYTAMADDDVGEAIAIAGLLVDFIAQATGTWASATLTLQGSNDGTNWFDLPDPQGTAIALTADGLAAPSLVPLYMRPETSGGSGTDIDVLIIVRTA